MPGESSPYVPLKQGPIIDAVDWSFKRRLKVTEKWRRKGYTVRFRDHRGKVDYA